MLSRLGIGSLFRILSLSLLSSVLLVGFLHVYAQKSYYPYFEVKTNFSAEDEIFDVAVSPNGKYIGISTKSYGYLLNSNGIELKKFETLHFGWGIAVSDTGLMAVGATNRIWLYDSGGAIWNYDPKADPEIQDEIKGRQIALRAFDLAITPDGRYTIASQANSYNYSKYVSLFDNLMNETQWKKLTERDTAVKSLAVSDDGSVIVAGGNDGSISVYDIEKNYYGSFPLEDRADYDIETPVDVTGDGNTIVSGNSLGTVFLFNRNENAMWDLNEDKPIKKQIFDQRPIAGIAMCSDYIFAISDTGIIQPLNRTDLTILKNFQYPNVRGQAIAASENCKADGRTGIVVTAHGNIATINSIIRSIPELDSEPPTDTKIVSAIDGDGKEIKKWESTTSNSMRFTFGGYDNMGIAGYDCNLDFARYSSCEDEYSVETGTHVLQVLAKDASGNIAQSPGTFLWQVVEPPEPTIFGMRWGEFWIIVITVPISGGTGILVWDILFRKSKMKT